MRTTKNVTVREINVGFVVNNNYERCGFATNVQKAEKIAREIAKAEGKAVVVNTDYFHYTIKAENV